jgi:hypothetical protein
MKVKTWKIICLMFLAIFVLSAANASATPTMSNMAGTYSSTTGYTIVLYENGTGLFSVYSGTWSIVNSTTIEGIYRIVSQHTDYFTITDNGFIAVSTGNVYVKTTSASPSPTPSPVPTASASANPTTSAAPTPTPTVPELSSAALILVAAAAAAVTLCTIKLAAKSHSQESLAKHLLFFFFYLCL